MPAQDRPTPESVNFLRRNFIMMAGWGLATCGLGAYIALNQDDGERFDVHQQVEPVVKQIMEQDPKAPENEVRQYVTAQADKMEKSMSLLSIFLAAANAAIAEWSYRKYRNAESRLNGPQP